MTGGSAAYRRVEVETASPEKLIVMLYNGAIKHVEDAKRGIVAKDVHAAHGHLLRAQEIVTELRGALDLSAGEVALNLDRIYDYLHRLMVQGNLKKDTVPLDESLVHLRGLRDTWAEIAVRATAQEAPAALASHNAHGNTVVNFAG